MRRQAVLAALAVLLAVCAGWNAVSLAKTEGTVDPDKMLTQQSAYPSWTGKKWTAVGDSHTEINFRAKKNYVTYIQEYTGIKVVNLGKSGMGWKRRGGFYQRIWNIPPDSDVITIYGSFNDLDGGYEIGTKTDTGLKTIGGCINKALDDLYARIPNANVGVITPCPWEQYTPLAGLVPNAGRPEDQSERAIAYCRLICDICEMRGIPCLDLFHCSGLEPWKEEVRKTLYTRDGGAGCHPDENGHLLIAPRFLEFLETLLAD